MKFGGALAKKFGMKRGHVRRVRAVGLRWVVGTVAIAITIGVAVKLAHHHTAKRPHNFLLERLNWYRRWHNTRYHHHAHAGLLVAIILAVGINTGLFRAVLASDLAQSWNFTNPGEYTLSDANAVEVTGTSARLKAQNYASDANTRGLWHFDEASGSTAADSSSNANNAAVTGGSFVGGNLNNALSLSGASQYAAAPDSASLSLGQNNTLEGWTKFSSAFSAGSHDRRQPVVDKGQYRLYYDNETGKLVYELANSSSTTWTQQAGNDIKGSWDLNGKLAVTAQVAIGSNVYAGLGNAVGDAEVWRWNGTTWTQLGGDGLNSSWAASTYETVTSMAANGNTLYAGLGNSTGDAEVWSCDTATNCTSWTKIGGDGINSGWAINTYEDVPSMTVMGGNLYVGLGTGANDARVYRWNGTSWTWVGGFGIGAPFNAFTTGYESVYSMANDGTNLYVGFGNTAGDADVWRLSGTTWTQIGGDALNSSWAASTYEYAWSMRYMGSNLYVGIGLTAGEAEVWRWNGTTWAKVGGDAVGSSWDGTNYEMVYALTDDGTNIYAGLGNTAGDNEVYRCSGCDGATPAWTKIGGDAVNSGFTNTHTIVQSLVYSGSNLYAGLTGTGASGEVWSFNGTSWTRVGGNLINKSWGFFNLQSVENLTSHDGKLYAGTGNTVAGNGVVWEFDGTSWTPVGGQGINGSWAAATNEAVWSMISVGGYLYAGLGTTAGDADLWRFNGTTWTQVGGDALNASWAGATFETVQAMAEINGVLYVGLGTGANDAEVWRCTNCGTSPSWFKVGGDSLFTGWTTNFDTVASMAVIGSELYVGLGVTATEAEVWRCTNCGTGSPSWSKIGGDGVSSSWNTVYETVETLTVFGGDLYAGLGNGTDDAEIWRWNGSTWTQVGGDDINSSWTAGTFERVRSAAVYNGYLYAGLGTGAGDGEVWRFDGTTWSQVGGDALNSSWVVNTIENVAAMSVYQGKLYVGTGDTANADAAVWSYGNNGYVTSSTTTQDTAWHHVAGTYDGATMKLYIDGVQVGTASVSLSLSDTGQPLYLGGNYGAVDAGEGAGFFAGLLDEIRVSDTARTSFVTLPYSSSPQTVTAGSVFPNGVATWDALSSNETPAGGTITFRVSTDDGATWNYWTGAVWGSSTSLAEANPIATVSANLPTLPVTSNGFKWQAILTGNGNQQVQLNSVSLDATADATAPTAPTSLAMLKASGGANVADGAWTNNAQPYFSWTAATDTQSTIRGYCAYLGTDNTADPASTKGLLGTSPTSTAGSTCPFIIGTTSVDFATPSLRGPTWLTSSSSPYYLRLRAIDGAGNVSANPALQHSFRFDNTAPANPAFITTPSQFVSSKNVTVTWPTSGGNAASDAHSGLVGLQYRIGASGIWYGDSHSGTQDSTDVLANDGSYSTVDPEDFDALVEGNNNLYVRTWDTAGNVSTAYVTGVIKLNSTSPSQPQNVTATPTTNTTNSFAFSWLPPASFAGDAANITYCYTVNTLPSAGTCTFTSAGVTSLGANAYATQPGDNTFYVVARDEASNINYATFGSTTFTANTSAPGIPLNVEIADISVKATNNWKLALSWEPPSDVGSGIASYKIYRSTNNVTFNLVASNSGASFVDTGLAQQRYYYNVKACDSANNCGASTAAVDALPTGRFTSPATLVSEPALSGISTRRATITWSTDRASDSKIALGTVSGVYSTDEVSNSSQTTSHTITLTNLQPGTTYYYKAKWTDEDGNTGMSAEQSFTTLPSPTVKEVTTRRVSLNSATVAFTTKEATKVKLYYGKSEGFGGTQLINTSTAESTYTTDLTGLDDGTKYFFKINPFDGDGNEYEGNIFSLTTPARPQISNLKFQPVSGEPTSTQKISWTTNVPTTSLIRYGLIGQTPLEKLDSTPTTEHEVVIRDLADNSEYALTAESRDGEGNVAVSDVQRFRTALDTRPPVLKNLTVETTIRGSGAEARGQVVVSWETDEPSTSQVAYAEGASGDTYTNRTAEDITLVTQHTVIVSDLPTSKVFHLQAVSQDKAGNSGVSEDRSTIVGRASDSVLSIIFNALRNVFSFLQ